jgi:hypothetical protein
MKNLSPAKTRPANGFPFELELKVSSRSPNESIQRSELTGLIFIPSPDTREARSRTRVSSQVHAVEFSKTSAAGKSLCGKKKPPTRARGLRCVGYKVVSD